MVAKPRRTPLIAFEGAYHGDTFGAMAAGDRSVFTEAFEELLFDVTRLPWPATHWGDTSTEESGSPSRPYVKLSRPLPQP